MEYYRLDFIYSYWIFAWFLLYLIGITRTAPIVLLYLGLVGNLFELIYLIYHKASTYNVVKFIIINTFLKVLPLYYVYHLKITNHELFVSVIMTIVYLIWLYINNVRIRYFYNQFLDNYKTGKGKKTIVSEYYDRLVSI
jgi:hypothetical protein